MNSFSILNSRPCRHLSPEHPLPKRIDCFTITSMISRHCSKQAKHGHCNVSGSLLKHPDEFNKLIRWWCKEVRYLCKLRQQKKTKRSKQNRRKKPSDARQVQRLNDAGFAWKKRRTVFAWKKRRKGFTRLIPSSSIKNMLLSIWKHSIYENYMYTYWWDSYIHFL